MLSLGKHITQKDDPLEGIEAGQLFEAVRQPETVTLEQIRRLRAVRKIDKKQYGLMKRELPYIVGGVFDPPYRRMENFGYIEYFILDIDHVSEKEMDLPSLRAQLQADSRVMLCFLSPGEDGLKLLFRLSERCFDAGRYSLFYKTFIRAFSQQYHFEQVIDSRTSDASRACFLSYDPDAYFNTEAEAIVAGDFVDFDNPFAIGELRHQIQKEMDGQKAAPTPSEPPAQATGPDEAAISFIKARLQAKSRQPKPKPQVYVPEELDDILEKLLQYIGESGVQVNTVENIQYGKKFRFHAGAAQAEVNLFFGHRGFTVVQSPRQGTSPRLNELMASYIRTFIDDYTLVNENLPLTQAPLPDKAGQIRQQANALNAVKNYAEALPLYRDLWNGHREACNEWDGWHYAFCLKQTKDYKAALDVCRQAWRLNPAFEPVKSLYAWCIYYTEITSEKVKDEARYFKAAKAVVQLCKQEDTYSAYTVTLFKVLNYLNGKASFPTEQLLTWTALLQPALLDDKAFRFTDRNGKERELASKREQYYMIRSRALLEAGRWDECLQLCEEALEAVKPLHYDNEVWFRWRIGLCYEGKGLYGEALKQQLALLSRKKEWFIQREIAEQYYRQGEYAKALDYTLDSALNSGDSDKKGGLYQLMAKLFSLAGKPEEAALHMELSRLVREHDDSKETERKAHRLWQALKDKNEPLQEGHILSILPSGKAGFIKVGKNRSYYFRLKDFIGQPAKAAVGQAVSFRLGKGFDKKKNCETEVAVQVKPLTI